MIGEAAAAIMVRQPRARARWPVFACVVVVLLLLCLTVVVAGSSHRTISVPPDAIPQTVVLKGNSAAEAAAAQGAVAAFYAYQSAYATAGQAANPFDPRLAVYAGDPALAEVEVTLQTMAENGLIFRGVFKGQIQVTKVSLSTQTVSLVNCQDISDLKVVNKATGKALATSLQNLRFPVAVHARNYQGRWIIVKVVADRTKRC